MVADVSFLTSKRDQLGRFARDRRVARIVRLGLSFGAFLILTYVVVRNWPILAPVLSHGRYGWLAVAVPIYLLAMSMAMLGWHSISRALDISRGVRGDSVSYALSTVAGRLPGGVWGLVARVYLYQSDEVAGRRVAAAWAIEQGLMLASALLSLAGWLIVTNPVHWGPIERAGLAVLLLALIGLSAVQSPLTRWASRALARTPFRGLAGSTRRRVVQWLGVYAVVWLFGGVLLFTILQVFGSLPLTTLPTVEIAWIGSRSIALLLTVLPTSLGVTEVSLALLLTPLVPAPIAVVAALCARLVTTLGEALVAGGAAAIGRIAQSGNRSGDVLGAARD